MPMSISEAARAAGCSAPTIRFYETIALIPPAVRTGGGRRTYGWPDVKRLQFIRRARDFGMSIDQIRELLTSPLDDAGSCAKAREIVRRRIDEVRERRLELARLEASLDAMAQRCDASCGQSAAMPCTIFEDITDLAL
ncbi:MAG: MerR family transcriptional regulator [Novosphingobium sp.]|uniref:MerR family transcriptional regulator n=1 Tax=Novosphingobium sp. TaxID=1874826 RepID=UPI001DA25D04|nr:MerR family transcriptional regulator [Novosphingobium sp.]MCB2057748.1 MerR family transcriptional regulator [Novosphingobium sp.]MCP5386065.1 MerR family transcriptional regulator [Novosphingobium sp.]